MKKLKSFIHVVKCYSRNDSVIQNPFLFLVTFPFKLTSTTNRAGVRDQAEQHCVLCVHLASCLYCTADQYLVPGWPQ